MSETPQTTSIPNVRTLAWDGVSFDVPVEWELAHFQRRKRAMRIEVEDRYELRLEAEWLRPKRKPDVDEVQRRYDRMTRQWTSEAKEHHPAEDLPDDWIATQFVMEDGRRFITAFYLPADGGLFAYFVIHFEPESEETPGDVLRLLISSLRRHDGDVKPWRLYDIGFNLPERFKLRNARFETGLKVMTFNWGFRELHLFHVSLADRVTKGLGVEEWAPAFLQSRRLYRGVRFVAGQTDEIVVQKNRLNIIGRYDEIGRMCFSYEARHRLLRDRNQIVVWLLHYRWQADALAMDDMQLNAHQLP